MMLRPLTNVMLPVPVIKPSSDVRSPVPSERLMFLLRLIVEPNEVHPAPLVLVETPPKVTIPVPLFVTFMALAKGTEIGDGPCPLSRY